MRAVRMLLLSRLRHRWRTAVLLVVGIGVGAGAVLALAAGARRADTAYDRFLTEQRAADMVVTSVGTTGADNIAGLPKAAALPQVAAAARADSFIAEVHYRGSLVRPDQIRPIATEDAVFGTEVDRFHILDGRMYDTSRPDEAVAAYTLAQELDLHVGDTMQLLVPTADEIAAGLHRTIIRGIASIAAGPPLTVRIVGIEISPGPSDVPPTTPDNPPDLYMSPAFYAAHHADLPPYDGLVVRLKNGEADAGDFETAVERLGNGAASFITTADQRTQSERGITVEAGALAVLAALASATLLCVLAQALSRQTLLDSADFPALRTIGATPAQLASLHLLWVAAISICGAGLAVVIAVLASPLFPMGTARAIEPSPGVSVDWLVLGVGAAAVVLLATAVDVPATVRAVRRARPGGERFTAADRPSKLVDTLSRLGLSAAGSTGVRLALSPGHGRTSVPLRATVSGCAIAAATVVAALSFSASETRLVDTPALYGWNADVEVSNIYASTDVDAGVFLRLVPGIGDLTGLSQYELAVDDVHVPAIVATTYRGDIGPTVTEGRAPTTGDEILLGTRTLPGIAVGDTVTARVGDSSTEVRVVGRGVLPPLGDAQLGNGVWLPVDTARRLGRQGVPYSFLIRYAPGATPAAVDAAIESAVGTGTVLPPERPTDVSNFGTLGGLPLVLAGLLAAAGVATLTHTLVTSVRRRRRELAVLKTIGFTRRQILATVAWQAATLALLATAAGVPLGLAAARWAWSVAVDRIGSTGDASVPLSTVAVIPVAVGVAVCAALVPGRLAAATAPAVVLAGE